MLIMKKRTNNVNQWTCSYIITVGEVRENLQCTHNSSFINHFIKYVDEDFVFE